MLNQKQQKQLLKLAKDTLRVFIRTGETIDFKTSDEALKERAGVFVSIYKKGNLRGCIGQLIPSEKPLWEVVRDMTIAASCEDSRFDPVDKKELKDITFEISVLTQPEKVVHWTDIKLGEHGVIAQSGAKAGVFLPQVAEKTGWNLEEFLAHLCVEKAGLEADAYKKGGQTDLFVFTAQVIE